MKTVNVLYEVRVVTDTFTANRLYNTLEEVGFHPDIYEDGPDRREIIVEHLTGGQRRRCIQVINDFDDLGL